MSLHHRDDRGSALIFALGFMTVVLVIALGVHTLISNELRGAGTQRRRVAAAELAEGALARTIAWFNAQAYRLPQSGTLGTGVPVTLTSNNTAVVLPTNHPNDYTDSGGQARTNLVTSFNSFLTSQSVGGGSYSVSASLINGTPETWEIVATANLGTVTRRVGGLLIRQGSSLFSESLFGRDAVTISGNASTDAYDSTKGAYGGSNKFPSGHIGSNGDIGLSGNASIDGNAVPGPGKKVTMSGNADVSGTTTPATTARTLTPMTVPAGSTNLGAVSLSGNSKTTLTAGNYQISSISISGNAELVINSTGGPVRLYVTGAISAAGNGISNASGSPTNLFIAQIGGSSVSYSGNVDFFGAIYAPDSALSLSGNSNLYGAFTGKSITLSGNAVIHYDQALQNQAGGTGSLKLMSQWNLL